MASARGRLAHAVYFWRGVLDVSPVSKDQPQRRETLGWFAYGALKPGTAPTAVVEPWHSLSPQAGVGWLLVPSAVLQVAAVWVFVVTTWGRIRGRRVKPMPILSRCFLRGGLLCLAIGMVPGGLILLQKGTGWFPVLWVLLPAHTYLVLIGG